MICLTDYVMKFKTIISIFYNLQYHKTENNDILHLLSYK
jgi:hypothetical protein